MRAQSICLVPVLLLLSPVASAQWVQTNSPFPGCPPVQVFAVSGTNLFAGTENGLFLSSDQGANWIAAGLKGVDVRALSVRGTKLLAGTWGGVFLSTNNGINWSQAGLLSSFVGALVVKDTLVFAGTGNGFVGGEGVFRSTNDGLDWTAVGCGGVGHDTLVNALAVHGSRLYAATNRAALFSTDNGASWNAAGTATLFGNINSIAVSPNGTDVFAGSSGGDVYRSTDSGSSWTAVGLWQSYVVCLAINYDGTNLYAGSEFRGVYRSTNQGASWFQINTGLTDTCVRSLAVVGDRLFAGTKTGGIFVSKNNGSGWSAVNSGLPQYSWSGSYVVSMAVSDNYLFAGTYGGSVLRSTDQGGNWAAVGLSSNTVGALAVIGSNVFAGTQYLGMWPAPTITTLFRSTDYGTTWTVPDSAMRQVRSLALTGSKLLAGTNAGVFLSIDSGSSWSAISGNIAVYALAISDTNLFALTADGISRTHNFGKTWRHAGLGVDEYGVFSLFVSGTNLFAGTNNGLFRSTNNGDNWKAVSGWGAISYAQSSGSLFAGSSFGGIFLSSDWGTSWTAVTTRAENLYGDVLAISGGNLFAGGGGIWRRPLSEMITSVAPMTGELPHQFLLHQNYPNPFNPATNIQFSIVNRQLTIVKVYDVLGREVAVLVNEVKDPGTYTVQWDASGQANGVYLCRMSAGSFVDVKKLVLLK